MGAKYVSNLTLKLYVSFVSYFGSKFMRLVSSIFAILAAIPISANAKALDGTIIIGAKIIDGTGRSAYSGNLHISNGKIDCVGKCKSKKGDEIINANGLVLAPGFIDTHSHHDRHIDAHPDALPEISQGVTSIVVGEDGDSALPLSRFFDARKTNPSAVNFASYVGHGTIRGAVMGKDYKRPASADEISEMEKVLESAMKEGALGLSTGLEYDPGIYSTHEEIVALAKVAAKYNGRYISHMRSEDIALDEAIDEVIDIGKKANIPVQISHLKIAMVDKWGQADKIIAKLDKARAQGINITADVYPYTYWQSSLDVLLPERDFKDRKAAEFALTHLAKADGLIITNFPPDQSYIGKSVADIAKLRGKDEVTTFLDLNIEAANMGKGSGVMGSAMAQDDVEKLILWKHSNICSDGRIIDMHPRGAGSFARTIAWLVRDRKSLSLETAVYKMTGLAAKNMGFDDRGIIAKNKVADLVLFDAKTIQDNATFKNPSAIATGVKITWVNGIAVFKDGKATGKMAGKIILRTNNKN